MNQPENEIDRKSARTYTTSASPNRDVQRRTQHQIQAVNTEPNSILYVLTPNPKTKSSQMPVEQRKQFVHPNYNIQPVALPERKSPPPQHPPHTREIRGSQNKKTVRNAGNVQRELPPVKRLANKFRKSGLGVVDSYFNAYFFYYQWKSEKKGRKPKDYLQTIAKHPVGWSRNASDVSVYEKNVYDKYLSFLTGVAKLSGCISAFFNPAYNFFRAVGNFFTNFGNSSKASKNIGYISQKTFEFLIPAASVFLTAMTIINISAFKPELALTLDGQNIGFVDSRETVGRVVSLLENNISSVLNEPYEFPGNISYSIVLSKSHTHVSASEIYNIMYNSSQNAVTTAYGLYIDGELVGAAENKDDINNVLNEVLEEKAADTEGETVEFANEIKIIENKYATRDVVTQDELRDIITYSSYPSEVAEINQNIQDDSENFESSAEELQTEDKPADVSAATDDGYETYSGETAAGTDDLAAMAAATSLNLTPETINTIPRGFLDSVSLADDDSQSGLLSKIAKTSASTAASVIQFKKIRTETYDVEVPFDVQYVESNQYYTGTQTIRTNGVNGENRVTADITYIGDTEVSREIQEIEILKEPINKVVVVGTKPKPVAAPTGGFIRPVKGGYISTYFTGGHRALDMVVPFGTSVSAADGGTVIYAGFSGSYGNHIKIRHSDGFVTLYAHLSSILVSYGDKLFQGQEIGKVGSTGNSTGNHLHFEIIKNGVQVNPNLYLK